MKKSTIIVLLMFSSLFTLGQTSKNINNYKYIIVPNKFDFLKEKDKYQLNSLTKFLFNKKITTFLEDENKPEELEDNCNAIFVDITDDSGMLSTDLILKLKNCNGDILFSAEGSSREKEYKRAYQLAVRDAYNKFKNFNYQYKPLENTSSEIKKEVKIEPIIKKTVIVSTVKNDASTFETLYAQKKENGFQLINTIPEIIYFIIKTNVEDVYIMKDKNGILYNKNGIWIAEYLENDKMMTKKYKIKF